MISDTVIRKLKDLAEIVQDSEDGYRTAADGTQDGTTKTLFSRRAEERHQMAQELRQCIRGLGAEPPQGGTTQGRVYRVWTSLKSALSSDDALAMLEECERGEDITKREFQEALNTDLPVAVRPALEGMFARLRVSHDEVKALRDRRRAS